MEIWHFFFFWGGNCQISSLKMDDRTMEMTFSGQIAEFGNGSDVISQ